MSNAKIYADQIEFLENQIIDLKEKYQLELQKELLPFIREHGRCEFVSIHVINIFFDSPAREKEFGDLLSTVCGHPWGNSYGVDIMEEIRLSSGDLFYSIFSAKPWTKESIKTLNINLGFDKIIREYTNRANSFAADLSNILELEKQFRQ